MATLTKAKAASIYMRASELGVAALGIMILAQLEILPNAFGIIGAFALLGSVLVLLRGKWRDEYLDGLWHRGTAVAFVSIVLLTLFGDFFRGIYDGFTGAHAGESEYTAPAWNDWLGTIAISAFFLGFHLKRILGR